MVMHVQHEVLRVELAGAYAKASGRDASDHQLQAAVSFLLDAVWAVVSRPDNFYHYLLVSAKVARHELARLASDPEDAHNQLSLLSETSMLALDAQGAIEAIRAGRFASQPELLKMVCEKADLMPFVRRKGRPKADLPRVITAWLAIHYRQLTGKHATITNHVDGARQSRGVDGVFFKFVRAVLTILGIKASPESQARKVIDGRRDLIHKLQAQAQSERPYSELPSTRGHRGCTCWNSAGLSTVTT